MLDLLYQELEAHLIAALNTNYTNPGFSKLGHVDLYAGQFELMERELPFRTPAIFISFPDISWATLSGTHLWQQQGTMPVALHVVQYSLDAAAKKTQFLAYLNEVHKAVQGWQGTRNTRMNRVRTQLANVQSQVMEHVVTYQTVLFDPTATPASLEDNLKDFFPKKKVPVIPPTP